MKKRKMPWSVSTTVRNPERLKGLLRCFERFDNAEWNAEQQADYQTALIQDRLYGYGNNQFYNGLSSEHVALLNDLSQALSFQQAKEIFEAKNYEDPPMRGRQSCSILKKFGFAIQTADDRVRITDLGRTLLAEDAQIGNVIFRSLLKWQIPNPLSRDYKDSDGYNIKPFLATMHLINKVNQMEKDANRKTKGISKTEFCLFAPTLIHHRDIEDYAEAIVRSRREADLAKAEAEQQRFVWERMDASGKAAEKLMSNLRDYGDNAIRYFRLTGYFYIRGNGFYIDLEPRRRVEWQALLESDDASAREFANEEEYQQYLSDIDSYPLPWLNRESYHAIVAETIGEIRELEEQLGSPPRQFADMAAMDDHALDGHIQQLRDYRKHLQSAIDYNAMQDIENIRWTIGSLRDIHNRENKPILLEHLSTFALYALNDAESIRPNYPVGDDNKPTFTAPGNMADIECFYRDFNAVCEVTMLRNRTQWVNEGQPVMRHLRDFEDSYPDSECYCSFVAPSIHRDTINTFWHSVKYEYEGTKQKIVPLTIEQVIDILEFLVTLKQNDKTLQQSHIKQLYDDIIQLTDSCGSSTEWKSRIPNAIHDWKTALAV